MSVQAIIFICWGAIGLIVGVVGAIVDDVKERRRRRDHQSNGDPIPPTGWVLGSIVFWPIAAIGFIGVAMSWVIDDGLTAIGGRIDRRLENRRQDSKLRDLERRERDQRIEQLEHELEIR